jgi:hypothetical protein
MKPVIAVLAVGGLLGFAALGKAHTAVPDPPKFISVESALGTDEAKIDSDLAVVMTDRGAGPDGPGEPACYNLTENVDSDVATIGYFVNNNVMNDRSNMQNVIDVIRQDMANFNNAIADFINEGVPRPPGAAEAVAEVKATILIARADANYEINLMKADVRAAYTIGTNMATGRCSDRGPGSPPSIPPIS